MAATLPSTLPSTLPRPDCHMDRSGSLFKVSDGLTASDLSMSATLPRPDCHTDRRGSFFKLIDTFALEIGELKQEMVQTSPTEDRDPYPMVLQGLEGELSGVYLQSSPCAGTSGERDSGYDSLRRRMSVLDRLRHTHPVWLLLTLSDTEATHILLQQPPGVFLVRKSSSLQRKVLSLRVSDDDASGGAGVCDFPVRESQYTFSLEGSGISFADLFRLVAFYCISRDVLPFTLNLPEAIAASKTQKDLEEVAQLGAGFWHSALGSLRRTTSPSRPPPQRPDRDGDNQGAERTQEKKSVTRHSSVPPARPPSSSSSRLERSQSNGALCFINPLFLQTHRQLEEDPPSSSFSPSPYVTHSTPSPATTGGTSSAPVTDPNVTRKSRPPRPPPPHSLLFPPPRSLSQRRQAPPPPTPLPQKPKSSMPETPTAIVVTRQPLQPSSNQNLRPTPRPPMGARHSSHSKKMTSSAAIPVPHQHPQHPPPRRPNKPDIDAHRCHIALDDETIAKALSRAKLPPCQTPAIPAPSIVGNGAGSPPSPPGKTPRREGQEGRLSDMSISTSSSDSLDYSHPPLSLPASPPLRLRHHLGNNKDSSDDEDLCDEEEEDYGVSLENDLDQGLRPPFKAHRRGVGVKVALSFRKVSGVFSTFMTPERRAVRRIAELSRDKSSYFGCLVQDYISFVQENKGCHTSGLDLLQTLRQFMTQMKAYLTQSSELDPPIESLIPEDQIDSVLEKAMHKCVLKPLKGVVEVALHDFQVSSGGWQQLRENLALAKTRRPQDLGVDGAVPPDPMAIEKIRHKFHNMRKMYSPDKKVSLLLRVCKLIYTIMQDNSGRMYGADDFLPMLTYVLAQCDMPQLDTEILYMMELLDPTLLHGEGGYYLTSAYGAMALIKNFQEEQAARVLSSEARDTLHQWHRRRTAQRTAPSVDDFQVSP
ncbi:ras and Rab interactor 2 isoform X2 [Oncorhynchus kisutch]|uniref:ras and Rab interactor 2 isoform X2 n=1 Tax=Oncorhynchus kisutch TaxID=8019 RepID=UPI0012DE431D|nr:ras and Rab interactor 2-like isoform X2 [Oncorhynchus kisutch]